MILQLLLMILGFELQVTVIVTYNGILNCLVDV